MPELGVLVEIDQVAVGCEACGWWVSGQPSEIELLVETTGAHFGPVRLAHRASVDGAPFEWRGDAGLVLAVRSG